MSKQEIEVITRLVIKTEDEVLLCKMKGADWYFLPGGHIEFGEISKNAAAREIQEEFGDVNLKTKKIISVNEGCYTENGTKHHEINLVYSTELGQDIHSLKSQEDHIEFEVRKLSELDIITVLPQGIKNRILEVQ